MPKPIEFKQFTHDETTGESVEFIHLIPSVNEICDLCKGEGKSSAYLGVFSVKDLDDEDFMRDYVAGKYDKSCRQCDGRGIVAVMDPAFLDAHPDIRDAVDKEDAEEAAYRAECRMERMYGA